MSEQRYVRRKLVNHTPSLTSMVEQLCIAAAHDVTVLIEGETGTGKTFLAKLVHDSSARRANRFLVVSSTNANYADWAGMTEEEYLASKHEVSKRTGIDTK